MPAGLPEIPPVAIAIGGSFLFTVLLLQVLVGYRKIHFKGRTHLKVHKALAWFLLVASVGHALGGLIYLGIFG